MTSSSTSTPPPPQQQQHQQQTQQIRHAGRAHVRGKIRRIWRPRYLELWDNGLVRYHELPAATMVNNNSNSINSIHSWSDIALPSELEHEQNHHHHQAQRAHGTLPKYTLQIFHARILDATTFRDMHVGLPRGAFGFVFRGQRLVHLELQEYAHQQFQSMVHQYAEHGGLSASAESPSLSLSSPTSSSTTLGLAASMSACQPSSSDAAAATGGGVVKEARDYLCAVSSLEEAQMWVVALQWAAANTKSEYVNVHHPHSLVHFSLPATGTEPWWNPEPTTLSPILLPATVAHPSLLQNQQHHYQRPTTTSSRTTATSPTLSEMEDWEHATFGLSPVASSSGSSPTTTTTSAAAAAGAAADSSEAALTLSSFETIPPSRTIGKSAQFLPSSAAASAAATTARIRFSKNDPTAPVSPFYKKTTATTTRHSVSTFTAATRTGKVVVTKVTCLTLVRISAYQWEMAYHVHGLMLRGGGQSSSSSSSRGGRSTTPQTRAQQQQQVQIWSMLRTAQDLERLVTSLCKELGPALLDRVPLGALRHLPRIQRESTAAGKPEKSTIPFNFLSFYSREEWIRSVAIVDSILRSLVSDASIVNATAMKVFLGLSTTARNLQQQKASSSSISQAMTTTATWSSWLSDLLLLCTGSPCHYHDSQAILNRTIQPLPEHATPDQYVKAWLLEHRSQQQQQQHQSLRSIISKITSRSSSANSATVMASCDFYTATILQRPILWLGAGLSLCAGCVVILSPLSAARGAFCFWQQHSSPIVTSSTTTTTMPQQWLSWPTMPSFAIRLDCLVLSWMGAAYIGRKHGALLPFWSSNSSSAESPSALSSKSKSSRKISFSNSKLSRRHATASGPSALRKSVESSENANKNNEDNKLLISTTSGTKVIAGGDAALATARAKPVSGQEDETSVATEAEESDECSSNISPSEDYDDDTIHLLSSPLPVYPANDGVSCWSKPPSNIFHVRSASYLQDRVKQPSGCEALKCRGVDVWMTDNAERHIARHPAVLGGKLGDEDTFLVNFLLPFGNFVAYFSIPPLHEFPEKLRSVWTKFLDGDQQYRDARLKLLPVVVDGPWIVKAAVGPGKSPALLGKVIPLQYFFRKADPNHKHNKRGVYEVDVIITASTIAKGILSVVKSHTNALSIAFAFIIEAAEEDELPETVLCSVQVHSLRLEDCPNLPPYDDNTDDNELLD
jgi:Protein ENHANCED DISEASE RESISTANCE 2, C-terminal